jgi:hypothetical protein
VRTPGKPQYWYNKTNDIRILGSELRITLFVEKSKTPKNIVENNDKKAKAATNALTEIASKGKEAKGKQAANR